ncbi:MAG: hypothetical protein DI603_11170 [Roseateles depolymerans]|uniref:PEP-CTERM protein-sorting domain-containing protein n=1 Tax=Roseateles depolymerans TaxID=76731 RepID=A0A2W5DMS8_9BURK|nr:MAG: hypothetical protein DI603_11170 [Roseateles depolymerans]
MVCAPVARAATLDAYAGGVGGLTNGSIEAGCYTSGTPAELLPFFQGGAFPAGGIAACGLTGGLNHATGSSGSVTSTLSVAPVKLGIPASTAGYYTGQADAIARYGSLGVSAQGSFLQGLPNGSPGAYASTVAAARFTDTLTATSAAVATGSAGFVRYAFELHGTASALGAQAPYYFGSTYVQLLYEQSVQPVQYGWNLSLTRGSTGRIQNTTPPPGWTTSTGYLSGASTFYSFDLPMVWGQSWDLTVGLIASAYGEVSADFLGTARLTGVQLFNSQHQEVTNFQLLSASGTDYLAPVPEAGTAWLLLAGLAGLAAWGRRRDAKT